MVVQVSILQSQIKNRIITDGSIVTESSTDTLTNKTISGATNTFNQIAKSALDNNSISIGGVSLNLGGTDATPALNLSDANSLSYKFFIRNNWKRSINRFYCKW